MKIRTAEQYQTRHIRRGWKREPRNRFSDFDPETQAYCDDPWMSVSETLAARERRQPLAARKPCHFERAVDIRDCFGLVPAEPARPPTRPDARPSTHATPMAHGERVGAYRSQTGRRQMTARQVRRANKKARRTP